MIIRDNKGRPVTTSANFARLKSDFDAQRRAEIDKKYGSKNGKF